MKMEYYTKTDAERRIVAAYKDNGTVETEIVDTEAKYDPKQISIGPCTERLYYAFEEFLADRSKGRPQWSWPLKSSVSDIAYPDEQGRLKCPAI